MKKIQKYKIIFCLKNTSKLRAAILLHKVGRVAHKHGHFQLLADQMPSEFVLGDHAFHIHLGQFAQAVGQADFDVVQTEEFQIVEDFGMAAVECVEIGPFAGQFRILFGEKI